MSKVADLFKSEGVIDETEEKVLIECPHCEEPITKAQVLEKAANKVADENKGGGHHKGPASGHNKKTPKRSAGHVPKTDQKAGLPGAHAKKSDAEETEVEEQETAGDEVEKATQVECPKCSRMAKAGSACKCGHMMKAISSANAGALAAQSEDVPPSDMLRFQSQYVQYVEGNDEEIAKAIQEGRLGQGAITRQPIDKNWKNS